MSSDSMDDLCELSTSPRTESSDFARFLREQLQQLETRLLMAYGEVDTGCFANRPRMPSTTQSSGTNWPPVQPRTGTYMSQKSEGTTEVLLGGVTAASIPVPHEVSTVQTWASSKTRCFKVHDKCNMTDEELESLVAPFVVTKPSGQAKSAIQPSTSIPKETWPRFLVHPESPKRLFWDCLACMMLFTYTIVVPTEVFHLDVDSAVMSAMLSVRSLWLFFWILDMGMTVRTAVYVDNAVCTQWSCILRKYVHSWLIFDLAFIGLDVWSIACLVRRRPILRTAALGKFIFMARGVFSFRFHKLLQHNWLFGQSGSRKACSLTLLILVILVIAVHLLACLWFFCGNVEDGWVETEQLTSESWDVQYTRSVQWALSRLPASSMASNMALNTGLERALALIATFSVLSCGSASVSVITNLLAGLERSRQHKKNMLKAVSGYIHGHNLSRKHLNRVKHIVEREKMRQEKMNQLKFLQELPEQCRQVLQCEARGRILSILSFYKTIQEEDASAEVNLCSTAVSELFLLAEDEVFRANVQAKGLFLVSGCTYSVLSMERELGSPTTARSKRSTSDDVVPRLRKSFWAKPFSWLVKYATVVPSDVESPGSGVSQVRVSIEDPMSEQALWVKAWQHQGSLRAHTTGHGVLLQTKQFYKVLAEHPHSKCKAVGHARGFVGRMNECLLSEASITDLPITGLY